MERVADTLERLVIGMSKIVCVSKAISPKGTWLWDKKSVKTRRN